MVSARLKSGIWVRAYIRRCQSQGVPAAVVRHGDEDAGAIFIRLNYLDGTSIIFAPAPSGLADEEIDRRLMPALNGYRTAEEAVEEYFRREISFDSDLWIIEVESKEGTHFLEDWLQKGLK